jgi:hypothetical protein
MQLKWLASKLQGSAHSYLSYLPPNSRGSFHDMGTGDLNLMVNFDCQLGIKVDNGHSIVNQVQRAELHTIGETDMISFIR